MNAGKLNNDDVLIKCNNLLKLYYLWLYKFGILLCLIIVYFSEKLFHTLEKKLLNIKVSSCKYLYNIFRFYILFTISVISMA
jgi:hypothetical protein